MSKPKDNIRKLLGNRLRELRRSAGYKDAKSLADAIKVHRNTVYCLERGDQWIGSDVLEKLSKAIGVPPSRFFDDDALPVYQDLIDILPSLSPSVRDAIRGLIVGFTGERERMKMEKSPRESRKDLAQEDEEP